jgi:hypothetical protein
VYLRVSLCLNPAAPLGFQGGGSESLPAPTPRARPERDEFWKYVAYVACKTPARSCAGSEPGQRAIFFENLTRHKYARQAVSTPLLAEIFTHPLC